MNWVRIAAAVASAAVLAALWAFCAHAKPQHDKSPIDKIARKDL